MAPRVESRTVNVIFVFASNSNTPISLHKIVMPPLLSVSASKAWNQRASFPFEERNLDRRRYFSAALKGQHLSQFNLSGPRLSRNWRNPPWIHGMPARDAPLTFEGNPITCRI